MKHPAGQPAKVVEVVLDELVVEVVEIGLVVVVVFKVVVVLGRVVEVVVDVGVELASTGCAPRSKPSDNANFDELK
jgi:hypothetical protein